MKKNDHQPEQPAFTRTDEEEEGDNDVEGAGDVSVKEHRAILALLNSRSVVAAAEQIGIHERTLRAWLARPEFAAAVRVARRQSLAQACTTLVAACGDAVEALRAVVEDKTAQPSARISAARMVLDLARAFDEHDDLAARIAALEERARRQGKVGIQ